MKIQLNAAQRIRAAMDEPRLMITAADQNDAGSITTKLTKILGKSTHKSVPKSGGESTEHQVLLWELEHDNYARLGLEVRTQTLHFEAEFGIGVGDESVFVEVNNAKDEAQFFKMLAKSVKYALNKSTKHTKLLEEAINKSKDAEDTLIKMGKL